VFDICRPSGSIRMGIKKEIEKERIKEKRAL
jgi:hypothetical protein